MEQCYHSRSTHHMSYIGIIFRDSLNHLPAALDALVLTLKGKIEKKNLSKRGEEDALKAGEILIKGQMYIPFQMGDSI